MATAPFIIDSDQGKVFAIFGLLCLTFQAYRLKTLNLVLLNVISIIGFLYALYN